MLKDYLPVRDTCTVLLEYLQPYWTISYSSDLKNPKVELCGFKADIPIYCSIKYKTTETKNTKFECFYCGRGFLSSSEIMFTHYADKSNCYFCSTSCFIFHNIVISQRRSLRKKLQVEMTLLKNN